jgi:hypothetical protein
MEDLIPLQPLETPIGDFIFAQTDIKPIVTANGNVYSYADVCILLNRMDVAKNSPVMIFYAIRSQDGKFFRSKGYGYNATNGVNWVDEISKARIYTRPAPAKSRITWFFKKFPEYGKADLIELHVTNINIFDEALFKANAKKNKKSSKLPKNSKDEYFKLKV